VEDLGPGGYWNAMGRLKCEGGLQLVDRVEMEEFGHAWL